MPYPYYIVAHSAKGSTWDEHKYILRKNGTYYYPDSYEGGRHLPDSEKGSGDSSDNNKSDSTYKIGDSDVEKLAWEVIRGNFGSGAERRERLGEYYQKIQDRVNEIWRETGGTWRIGGGSTQTSSQKVVEEAGQKAVEAAVAKVEKKGFDLSAVYEVYTEQEKRKKPKTSSESKVKESSKKSKERTSERLG